MNTGYLYRNIILFFWLIASVCYSQKEHEKGNEFIRFDRMFSENIKYVKGLSQNWIYAIHQDKYGYMWFGTWEGLNKYDGYNFTIYNMLDGLSDHSINCILEDEEGFIWLGTARGLNRFDRKKQLFTQYLNLPGDSSSLYYNRIQSIIQSKDGKIWIGTGAGLYAFDKKSESFTPYFTSDQEYYSPRSNYIIHLLEDDKGILWISTTYGLVKFDPGTKRSARYYHIPGDKTSISHNNVRYVLQEKSGNFWIGTREGLNYFDTTNQTIRQFFSRKNDPNSLSDDWIRVIYEDQTGNVWIGTENGGLNLYDKTKDRFIRFQNILNDKYSISNDRIYSIYEDITGNLWIGTYHGVNKINKYSNYFEHCQRTGNDDQSLNDNIIWAFAEDDQDNLWIGTNSGINIKNNSTGKFKFLLQESGNPYTPSGRDVRTICYTPQFGCFWIGYWGAGMDKYDIRTGQFTNYKFDQQNTNFNDEYINDILADKNNMLWIATGRGVNLYNPKTGKIESFRHSDLDTNSISHDVAICLYEDHEGNIWIGTNYGLNRLITGEKKVIRYLHEPENQNSLSNNTIFCINQDKKGNIWIGTSGGGLNCFNPENKSFVVYNTTNGLPNNIVYGILESADGHIWISTNMGLSKLNMESGKIVSYDVKDGIQSSEFNLGAYYKGNNGRFYLGGMNGYNVFDPEKIAYNTNVPVTVIAAFRKYNEAQPAEYTNGDTINLKYNENFFSIEISALDFTNPAKNKYRYKLDNVDKDWIIADANNRVAEYKMVRPGIYKFSALGSNNDGVWGSEAVTLTIIIKPAWWTTRWFRILLVFSIIFILVFLVYWRIKRIKKKHDIEKKLLEFEKQKFELEQKALRLQMNPHFIFNSLNSIQSYILDNDTEKAVLYLGKFSQLMRLILSHSSNKYISLKEELNAITYYLDLEKLRFEDKFDYSIQVDMSLDEEFIEIPPMIIQPYIENAVIHGMLHKPTRGRIEIELKRGDQKIICTIKDDGVGRQRSMEIEKQAGIEKKSKGMLITKARLEILNRQSKNEYSVSVIDLKDKTGNPCGTKVELIIHYKEEE